MWRRTVEFDAILPGTPEVAQGSAGGVELLGLHWPAGVTVKDWAEQQEVAGSIPGIGRWPRGRPEGWNSWICTALLA